MQTLFEKFPLFGSLLICRMTDHAEAAREFFIGAVVTILPIIGGLLVGFARQDVTWLLGQLESGILAIYACAVISPVFYVVHSHSNGARRAFPSYAPILIVAIILVFASGLFFIVSNVEGLFGVEVEFDDATVLWTTGVLFLVALLVTYTTLVYRNFYRSGAARVSQKDDDSFVKNYAREN